MPKTEDAPDPSAAAAAAPAVSQSKPLARLVKTEPVEAVVDDDVDPLEVGHYTHTHVHAHTQGYARAQVHACVYVRHVRVRCGVVCSVSTCVYMYVHVLFVSILALPEHPPHVDNL